MINVAIVNVSLFDQDKKKAIALIDRYKAKGEVVLVGNGEDCSWITVEARDLQKGMCLGDREVDHTYLYPNGDVEIYFVDGSKDLRSHEYVQTLTPRRRSLTNELQRFQNLLTQLDLPLGLLCPDQGRSVHFVRQSEDVGQSYYRDTSTAEGEGLNFRLPNDGLIQMVKQVYGRAEYIFIE